jgi:tRNA-2-methylthio-N6-dimethylallyladenosine synthase
MPVASIYIETHGCQMNEADSQYIADRAASAGYAVAERAEDANVVILNTCTVRDNAERRAYGRMGHFKSLKSAHPALKLIVTGCLAEQDRDRMRRIAPHVDAVFGTSELAQLGDAIARWRDEFSETDLSQERDLVMPMGGSPDCVAGAFSPLRGFVTVQRGCSYYCTFCIVPHVRGRFDHRPMAEVLNEAQQRVSEGAREIMLVGQTVNAYRDPAQNGDFGRLCTHVAQIPDLERLTFISPHPKDFTREMLRELAQIPQLNPRIHLPMQSASDPMLRRMNRKYNFAQYMETVQWIREFFPQGAITTDFIVGFPGETERDFQATLDCVGSGTFANAYMFIYSKRRGTPAAHWEQVDPAVASERFARLAEAQNAVTRAFHDRKLGTEVRALVQGVSKKDRSKLAGKTLDNVTVIVPQPPDYDERLYAVEPWLDVRVDSAHVWGCSGTIVRRARRFQDRGLTVKPALINLLTA